MRLEMSTMKKAFEKKIEILKETVEKVGKDLTVQIWDRDREIEILKNTNDTLQRRFKYISGID